MGLARHRQALRTRNRRAKPDGSPGGGVIAMYAAGHPHPARHDHLAPPASHTHRRRWRGQVMARSPPPSCASNAPHSMQGENRGTVSRPCGPPLPRIENPLPSSAHEKPPRRTGNCPSPRRRHRPPDGTCTRAISGQILIRGTGPHDGHLPSGSLRIHLRCPGRYVAAEA
jgi:hypothetical protein